MKRKTLIIFILFLIAIIVFLFQFNVTPKNNNSTYTAQKPQTQNTKEEPKQNILDIRKQIEEQMRKEQEIKAQQEKLLRLQNPEYIMGELKNIGELLVYEGNTTYKDLLIQRRFLNKRELNVTIIYRFALAMNLDKITVDKIEIDKNRVVLNLPIKDIHIEYLEIVPDKTTISGETSLLASKFKPSEIEFVYEMAQQTTLEKLNNTDDLFFNAKENLKDNLAKLLFKLGYKRVAFNEI